VRQATSILVYVVRHARSGSAYLLLHRRPMPQIELEAFWQGVSGGLEDDEVPLQAALRELSEETGIVPTRIAPTGFVCSYPIRESWRQFYPARTTAITEHCFIAQCALDQEPTLSKEHDMYRWCGIEEAIGLLHFTDNVKALRSCEGMGSTFQGVG
jgi:8-oxo-dGTP pyrophosphatase MutT (NUDIX family)